MKKMGKRLGSALLVLCMVMTLLPTAAFAADTGVDITGKSKTDIQSEIQTAIDAAATGDTVTVTGSATNLTSVLSISIPSGVTVIWKASYAPETFSYLYLINQTGEGTFEVAEGGVLSSPTSAVFSAGDVTVNGGMVTSTGIGTTNYAIYNNYGNVTVSGGTVSATVGRAIYTTGADSAVTVSDGTVSSDTGSAIYATGDSATVAVSGGMVTNAAQYESYPVINMTSTSNTSNSVMVSGTGKVQATVSGCKAIKSCGNVTVEGNAEVSAISGGISTSGNVTVNGGTISTGGIGGSAIVAEGTNSIVTVNNGTVSCVDAGKAICAYGDSATVTVNGGIVSADGNGNAIYVPSTNPTVMVSGGAVSSDMGRTIDIGSTVIDDAASRNGNVMVTGGTVHANTNTAIYTTGDLATVTVSGGTVSNSSLNENCPVIYMSSSDSTFNNVTVNNTGKVQAKAAGGLAIITYGNVTVEDEAQVIATSIAILSRGPSSTVTVSGGVVFAYGSNVIGSWQVIYLSQNSGGFSAPTGTGVVIAWNQNAGTTTYDGGSSTDLIVSPEGASAMWGRNNGVSGISYSYSTNSGFIVVDGVTATKSSVTTAQLSYTDPFTLSLTYNGSAQAIGDVTAASGVTLGAITVYYTGTGDTSYTKSTTVPTNAGTYQVTVDVEENDSYTAISDLTLGTYTIAKAAAPTLTWPTTSNITYGQALSASALTGGSTEYGAFAWTDETVVLDVDNSGFEVTFTPSVATLQNYETIMPTTQTVSVTVAKATAAGVSQTYQVASGFAKEYSFDLTTLLSDGVNASQVSAYAYVGNTNDNGMFNGTPSVSGTTLTLPVNSIATSGLLDTVTIGFTSANYDISNATIIVETIDKIPVTISVDMTGGVYNGQPYSYSNASVTANTDGSDVTGSVTLDASYEGVDSTTYGPSTTAPTDAGSYQLTLSMPSGNETYTGSAVYPFTIAKRPVTVKADDKSVTVGSEVNFTYTVDGQLSSETALSGEPYLAFDEGNTTNAGSFTIDVSLSGVSYTDNYTAADPAYVNGTLTVSNSSSGNDTSSSGGSSTPATPTTPAPTVSGSTATTTVTANTGIDGKAAASVTQSQMSTVIEAAQKAAKSTGEAPCVEIQVSGGSDASAVETTLSKAAVQALVTGEMESLSLSGSIATMTFDAQALAAIVGAASGDVTISAAQMENSTLSDVAAQVVGDRSVYQLSVTSGSETISQFDGTVTVSLPYTPASDEDVNAIVAYYINADGEPELMQNCHYDAEAGTLVFTTTHFSTYAVGYNKIAFSDVSNAAWYADTVSYLAAREITSGTTETTFSPDATLTRGQFITLLMRAYDIDTDDSSSDNFSDAGNTYYIGYLAAAKRLAISNGVGDNKFAPEQAITRQDMFTLLYNALKAIDQLPEGDSGNALSDFTDSANISSYAQEAMAYLVKTSVVGGDNGQLSPTDTSTRAQMAQVLYNLLSK